MNDIITNMDGWLGVIGFVMTIATLLMTLNIRGKIEQTLGKQRFAQQREDILENFASIRDDIINIRADDCDIGGLPARFMYDLRALALRLIHFKIWKFKERGTLRRFIDYLNGRSAVKEVFFESTREREDRRKIKHLVRKVDEVIAIVDSHADI